MQKIVIESSLDYRAERNQALWLYNALDCATTLEVWNSIQHYRADPDTALLYSYTKGMRRAAMLMTRRGIRIDPERRAHVEHYYRELEERIERHLHQLTLAICGQATNPRSSDQVSALLYQSMRLPPQYKYDKKTKSRRLTTDIEALEKLQEFSHEAHLIISHILACREVRKKLSVVRTAVDADNRMRFAFNVAGPSTGRWSSNENPLGTGTNGQNLTEELRRMFVADPGWKLGNADLGQADSRGLAYISEDEGYIAACEGPDLHTTVAKMIWSDFPWPDDIYAARKLAEENFYRHFSRRDISKRGGHAANYMILAQTMSQRLKIPVQICLDFITSYYRAFPGIAAYHRAVQVQLATDRPGQRLYSPSGRRRHFFGSPYDNETLRAAVAHLPQSLTGDILNIGLNRLTALDPREIQLLAQIHDAVLFQYRTETEAQILPKVLEFLTVKIPVGPRTLIIPAEMKIGWNWGNYLSEADAAEARAKGKRNSEANLYGLRKWSAARPDERQPPSAKDSLLDYVLR